MYTGVGEKTQKYLYHCIKNKQRAALKTYAHLLITDKKRELKGGEVELYGACDSLEKVIRQIYKRSGMKGASSHSGRKSLVTNSVIRKGVPLETMAKILGHADPEMALNYLDICQERLEQMYEIAL